MDSMTLHASVCSSLLFTSPVTWAIGWQQPSLCIENETLRIGMHLIHQMNAKIKYMPYICPQIV